MAIKPDRRHEESVFFRLLAVLVLLAALPCASISYIVYSLGRSTHIEQVSLLLSSLAADRELTTRLLIEKQRDALALIAKDPKTARFAGGGSSSVGFLDRIIERNPFFAGLSVMDAASGRRRTAGTFPQEALELAMREAGEKHGGSFVRAQTLPNGERVLLIGQPVQGWDKNPGHSGVLLGMARFTIFDELYKNTSMLGAAGESFMTDTNGVALTRIRYPSHKKHNDPISAKAMQDCLAGNSNAFVITPDYAGVPTAMSYRPINKYGGCVMVHMRASEVMDPVKALRNMVVAIVATIIAAIGLAAFLVTKELLRMDKERKRLEEDLSRHGSHMEALVAERTLELKNEIKGRMDAEFKLRENKIFLENIVHNVHEIIFVIKAPEVGGGFRFVWWNANGEKLIGAKSPGAAGRTLSEVFGPDIGGRLALRYSECLNNVVIHYEENFNMPDGAKILLTTLVPVKDETGRVTQIISSAIDMTERKKLEAEMVKAQKLESLGVLAGGIAHDFNNLLAVIRLNISMLHRDPMLNRESLELIKLVDNSTVLATNLTNQLLTFAKGGKPVKKAVPTREFLCDAANFSLSGKKTTCKFNLADGLYDMEADHGQMTQVINNMLINADQAMPEGGVVTLSAENMDLTGLDKDLPLKPGRYVKITIEDHGAGIAEENLSRIFDPYFTTKKKGSGLGLASSHSIIKNHNGHISVRSGVGRGAVFEVFVPALIEKANLAADDCAEVPVRGSGRLLVMDDDDIVRISVCKVLNQIGYDTDSASNGQEAVLKYKESMENGKPFEAVILDLTVPVGMGGEEAVKKILELDGSAKVFVSSGYSKTSVLANFKKYGFCGFLKKPYDTSELERKLYCVLFSRKTI